MSCVPVVVLYAGTDQVGFAMGQVGFGCTEDGRDGRHHEIHLRFPR